MAVGQVLVVLTRNIDLSMGSVVGFTAYFVGTQLASNNDMAPITVALLAVGMGALLGAINGFLVSYGRVPAIITTLGTLALYRTFLVEYSNSQSVITSALPQWIVELPTKNFISFGEIDLRVMFIWSLIILVLFQLVLNYLPWGRRLYAIGSNPEAAHLVGLPVERTVFSAFGICGALSGLAGFMYLARFGNITVVAGLGLELQVVAAVVVGGINIFGGSGSMVGALLGTVLIATLEQSLLRWPVVSEFWRDALLGLLILMAVAVDAVILDRIRTLWARSELQMTEIEAPPVEEFQEGNYVA
jgi:rhamnose transport system permease protein